MVFETVAMSVITLLLMILLFTRRAGKIKLLLGVVTAACALCSMVFFLLMQKAAGNPDAGKEVIQLYIPCAAYIIVAVIGWISVMTSRKKIRLDKAAKIVAKNKGAAPTETQSE